jgi:hypothetical protein
MTSATLPAIMMNDVRNILQINRGNTHLIKHSNDHPNVSLCIHKMLHPVNSYLDLAFLIPENPPLGWMPQKFLIFFDDITESIAVTNFLRKRLPPELHHMIKWFNADMSPQFWETESAKLKAGMIWGRCCTDSFGMVSAV